MLLDFLLWLICKASERYCSLSFSESTQPCLFTKDSKNVTLGYPTYFSKAGYLVSKSHSEPQICKPQISSQKESKNKSLSLQNICYILRTENYLGPKSAQNKIPKSNISNSVLSRWSWNFYWTQKRWLK